MMFFLLWYTGTCREDEFTCDNLMCISVSQACNGKLDCWDGSDEAGTLCGQFLSAPSGLWL